MSNLKGPEGHKCIHESSSWLHLKQPVFRWITLTWLQELYYWLQNDEFFLCCRELILIIFSTYKIKFNKLIFITTSCMQPTGRPPVGYPWPDSLPSHLTALFLSPRKWFNDWSNALPYLQSLVRVVQHHSSLPSYPPHRGCAWHFLRSQSLNRLATRVYGFLSKLNRWKNRWRQKTILW